MACPFCRMPGGPCSSVDSSVDGFSVVLDRRCWRRVVRIPFIIVQFLAHTFISFGAAHAV